MTPTVAAQTEKIATAIALQGMDRQAIINTYSRRWRLSERTIDKRIAAAAPHIARLRQEGAQSHTAPASTIPEAGSRHTAVIIPAPAPITLKGPMMSVTDKRLLLANIMTGSYRAEVQRPVFNPATGAVEVVTYYEAPKVADIVKAIAEDNRMAGDYAPEQKTVKHTGAIGSGAGQQVLEAIAARIMENARKL